jgi:nanoRNase/pAp phosphatase (c-di-AMP/oligoRNAs hydrolase)
MQQLVHDKKEFGHLFHHMDRQVVMEQHLYETSLKQIVEQHQGISYGKGGHPLAAGHKIIADYLQAQIEKRFKFKTTKA